MSPQFLPPVTSVGRDDSQAVTVASPDASRRAKTRLSFKWARGRVKFRFVEAARKVFHTTSLALL